MSSRDLDNHTNTKGLHELAKDGGVLLRARDPNDTRFAQALDDVQQALAHRLVREDPRRVVDDKDIPLLNRPLVERVLAGVLPREQIISFARGVVNGGVPLSYLRENSVEPLTIDNPDLVSGGHWLPSYLTEREVELPSIGNDSEDFNIQHQRILRAIQDTLITVNPELPVFFLGSAASTDESIPFDIDIGTSQALRSYFMAPIETSYDTFASSLIRRMHSGAPILGMKTHVGAVWGEMGLALGISVTRYGRAFRVSASSVFIVEAKL